MLRCTVKFCGGCNPRYERGDAYKAICAALQDTASFSYPEDGVADPARLHRLPVSL